MKGFKAEDIRNVTVLGHIGSGKTSFVESCLLASSTIKEKGEVSRGTTVSDYLKEEKDHGMSLQTSVVPVEWRGNKINFLDTPGLTDLTAEVTAALKVSSSAVLVIDADGGVEVGTEACWDYLRRLSIPTFIFINKMDKDNVDYESLVNDIREKFGKRCIPLCIPDETGAGFSSFTNVINYRKHDYSTGTYQMIQLDADSVNEEVTDYRAQLEEACAEVSDELLEKYFSEGELSIDDIYHALTIGQLNGEIVPILVGSASKDVGIDYIMNKLIDNTYPPVQEREQFADAIDDVEKFIDPFKDFSAFCFKTTIDPFLGQMNYVQVKSGHLKKDQVISIGDNKDKFRINNIYFIRGKNTEEVDKVYAGDICVITKIEQIKTNETIHEVGEDIKIDEMIKHPSTYFKAIAAKNQKEDEKLGAALNKIILTDRSLSLQRKVETNQLIIGGLGSQHLDLVVEKLKNTYGVEAVLIDEEIVYRETILGTSQVQGKFKKQSGGSGQYGDVWIKFSPTTERFEFAEEIFGGAVPKQYIPAVEKGLEEAIEKGCLAGYPVIGLKAVLYDGSYHDVDSSEFAFKMAASLAYKDGFMKARPALMEPIMNVSVIVPIDYTGDVIGDFSRRRGLVLGMEPIGGKQLIKARVPQSEMLSYTVDLKQMSQGRGTFEMSFDKYELCPENVAQEVIKRRQAFVHHE